MYVNNDGKNFSGCMILKKMTNSSNLPSYQIRHRVFGVYQGDVSGIPFWYPLTNTPELGYAEFFSLDYAKSCIEFLCSAYSPLPLRERDLTIEPFDKVVSDAIQLSAKMKVGHA